jgi:hypothetical protein
MLDNFPQYFPPNEPVPVFKENPEVFFETRMEPLYARQDGIVANYEIGPRAGSFSGVFRNDNDNCLGVHKEGSYTLVNNRPYFEGIQEKLIEYFNADDLLKVKIKDSVSHLGSSVIRQYVFESINSTIESRSHSTTLTFRVIAWNCFDGSTKASVIFGNIDDFCTNGLISGQYQASSRKRTSGFVLDTFVGRMDSGLEQYQKEMIQLQKYAETPVLIPYVTEFFEKLSGVSERNAKRLNEQFLEELSLRGPNLWAVVSTLTNYASHTDGRFPVRETGNSHEGVTLLNRQAQVGKWLNSKAWNNLVEIAA